MVFKLAGKRSIRTLTFLVIVMLFIAFSWTIWADAELKQSLRSFWEESLNNMRTSQDENLRYTPVTTGPTAMNPLYNTSEPPRERVFNMVVRREERAPDGVTRLMYTINGEFPGPTLEVTEGDTVVVRVRNEIFDDYVLPEPPMSSKLESVHKNNDTDRKFSLHWHGMSMRGTQGADGASAFTTCALKPGDEREYRFLAHKEDVGTHWYHSHVGTSRADGLWGMLIVHSRKDEREIFKKFAPKENIHWDEEVAIALGDHFHKMSPISLAFYVSRWSQGAEPVPDSGLINGKHRFTCKWAKMWDLRCPAGDVDEAGEYAKFSLSPDRRYRLRLVNVGSLADQTFSVDGHTLTVIEADGTLVEPKTVHRVPLAAGQRYSVILNPDPKHPLRKAWMRSEMSGDCFQIPNPVLEYKTRAVVAYDAKPLWEQMTGWLSPLRARSKLADFVWERRWLKEGLPKTEGWNPNITDPDMPNEPCHDLEPYSLAPLIYDPAPSFHPELGDIQETIYISVPKKEKWGIVPMAYMNYSTWRPYGNDPKRQPLLHRISYANSTSSREWEQSGLVDPEHELTAVTHPSRPITYELVINNQDDSEHPFHLHGHKFWVLETGEMNPMFGGFDYYEDKGQKYDLGRAIKRDTVHVPMMGHAVIRWRADNPGVWAFHCHMLVHLASGMAMAFVEQPELLQANPPVPPTCR